MLGLMQNTSTIVGSQLRERWAGVPGVKYAQERRVEREDEDTLLRMGYVPTSEVAESMGRSAQTARRLLRRAGASPLQGAVSNELYWPVAVAEKAIAAVRALPRENAPRAGELKSEEVCRRLGVSRTSLQRITERGLLHPRAAMLPCGRGYRIALLYEEREVQAAGEKMNAQKCTKTGARPSRG